MQMEGTSMLPNVDIYISGLFLSIRTTYILMETFLSNRRQEKQ